MFTMLSYHCVCSMFQPLGLMHVVLSMMRANMRGRKERLGENYGKLFTSYAAELLNETEALTDMNLHITDGYGSSVVKRKVWGRNPRSREML